MKWDIETSAWTATIELTDPEVLSSIKLAASGATEFFSGIAAFDCDAESEVKEMIELELLHTLAKKYEDKGYGLACWI